MKQFASIILLASAVLATPLSVRNDKTPVKPSYITSCEAAFNCEIYTDSKGKLKPRFKSGMEPGTAAYEGHQKAAKTKRGGSSTEITVSDSTVYWGCDIDPVATLGNLSAVCKTSGACLSGSPYTLPVSYVDPTSGGNEPNPDTLTISATGNYPIWLRDGMVDAFQGTMAAKGVISSQTANWGGGPIIPGRPGALPTGSCQVSKAPSEIIISYYSAPNTLEASVDMTVALAVVSDGLCGGDLGNAEALVAAISGAFGAIGADIAAIFGSIGATCTASTGT